MVRATGGLRDTVSEFDPATGRGTGFVFEKYDAGELVAAITRMTGDIREAAGVAQTGGQLLRAGFFLGEIRASLS